MATKLEALTKDLPSSVRLLLREALDQTHIKNPNDPIYELMLVLGLWGKYYQSIPDSVRKVAEEASRSFDGRITQFHHLAQLIQTAIDKLEEAPKALETLFPSESVARSIAGKVDEYFRALPLMQLEADVKRVEEYLKHLLGTNDELGLANKVENSIERLEETVKLVTKLDPARTPWWHFLVCFLAGAVIAGAFMWTNLSRSVRSVNHDLAKTAATLTGLDARLANTRTELEDLSRRIEAIPAEKLDKIVRVKRGYGEMVLVVEQANVKDIITTDGLTRIYMGLKGKPANY